jgi:DegV family protein with EDD domain
MSAGRQVAIVTDSTSDIEPARAAALGIDVVPLYVIFGDKQYRDYIDLSRREFYAKFASSSILPTTSQPTAQAFADAFRPHVEAGRPIVCIVVSTGLSGTLNAAKAGAAEFPNAQIELFDSRSACGGLGLFARNAADLADAGASFEEIVASTERMRATQYTNVTIPDLSHTVRTGRISRAQAFLGGLLKIVPVLRLNAVDGRVEEDARVRTFARAQETMFENSVSRLGNVANARISIGHTNAPEIAQALLERFRARLPVAPKVLEVVEAGPVVAVHVGQGALAIFTFPG